MNESCCSKLGHLVSLATRLLRMNICVDPVANFFSIVTTHEKKKKKKL